MAVPTLQQAQDAMRRAPAAAREAAAPAAEAPVLQAKKRLRFGRIDIPLLTIVLVILLFGLVMLFSASYPSGHLRRDNSYAFISDQMRYVVIGLVGMVGASLVDYRLLKKFAWPLMVVTLMLLTIVLFMADKNDAKRWIWFNAEAEQGFQPSEIAKFALILVFAKMIHANQARIGTFKYGVFPFMLVLGTMALLLLLEPHISCTILVLGIGLTMMFTGGTKVHWFVLAAGLVVGVAVLAVTQFPDLIPKYAFDRIAIWQDPFAVERSKSHQTIQSLIAVGSGGVTGRGIGQSVQKFLYLPEVYNDYIFAVVCEELGLIGALAVILLFLVFLVRCVVIAMRAEDKFGAMLVIGIAVQVALQAFLHIAVNLNAIPSTGISLPFFSYGGTSLCMLLGQIGIVLSVSRRASLAAQKAAALPGEGEGPGEEAPQAQEVG